MPSRISLGGLPFNIDRGDLLFAFAPKPLLICYTTHDEGETYSPEYEESTKNIYRQLQQTYGLLGAKEKVGLYASHLPHGLDFFNRTQAYGWFNRWLGDPDAGVEEAEFDAFPEELLNATSTGQVLTSLGGRSVVQSNADRAQIIMSKGHSRSASSNVEMTEQEMRDGLVKMLALPQQRQPLSPRTRSSNRWKSVNIEEVQFESEPGPRIPGWFVKPASRTTPGSTVLYLTDRGGDTVVAEPGSMDALLAAGHAVCAISLRGLGITTPRFPRGGPNNYGSALHLDERFAWSCLVLGSPVVGQRVWDTLRAIDYLTSRSDVDPMQIRLLGTGSTGLAALMAGFLDRRIRSVLLDKTLVGYVSILESSDYSLELAWFVPAILRSFDLPDLAAGLRPRPCWILNGTSASGETLPELSVREQYKRRFHQNSSAFSNIHFLTSSEHETQARHLDWPANS